MSDFFKSEVQTQLKFLVMQPVKNFSTVSLGVWCWIFNLGSLFFQRVIKVSHTARLIKTALKLKIV